LNIHIKVQAVNYSTMIKRKLFVLALLIASLYNLADAQKINEPRTETLNGRNPTPLSVSSAICIMWEHTTWLAI
jgi:hypothetical protein